MSSNWFGEKHFYMKEKAKLLFNKYNFLMIILENL